jgi:EAL domain-containing protein (putative c-di-GMP-specific phosphodiesterase class I)
MATAVLRSTPPSSDAVDSRAEGVSSDPRGRILIVDDEPALLRGLARVLGSRGYAVTTAPNGAEAQRTFAQGQFDLVLTDISMPECDGLQLLQQVRNTDADIPVVLITGEPSVGTAVKALECGAFHYLTKPVDFKTLDEVVDKAVCLRRMTLMKRQAADLLSRNRAHADLQQLQVNFTRALDTLWMAFQPIVYAQTGSVFGYEALLRSSEPTLPHPGAVLDAAEQLNQLDRLGRAIRGSSARPMANAPDDVALFVNLHTTDLLDPELVSKAAPLSSIAHRVVLEVTERSSIDKIGDLRERVGELRRMGFRIAVDDLGAGYAGLTSFALLEPEIVKLDMSLVRDVHKSATRRKLIHSMSALCHDMGMLVVGEGVETVEERDTLVDLGCDLLQGYFFAKPGRPFPGVAL